MPRSTVVILNILALSVPVCTFGSTLAVKEVRPDPLIEAPAMMRSVSGGTALYDDMIGTDGNAVLSDNPIIASPTMGILTFAFVPTSPLSFDLAMQGIVPSDAWSADYKVIPSPGDVYSEATKFLAHGLSSKGDFEYPDAAVNNANIAVCRWQNEYANVVKGFGLQALAYDTIGALEPGTLCLIGLACVGLSLTLRWSQSKRRLSRRCVTMHGIRRRLRLIRQE